MTMGGIFRGGVHRPTCHINADTDLLIFDGLIGRGCHLKIRLKKCAPRYYKGGGVPGRSNVRWVGLIQTPLWKQGLPYIPSFGV